MDLIGKKVIHKAKYGSGEIVSQKDSYISVRFDSIEEEKTFSIPGCFESFLQLLDAEAAAVYEKEVLNHKEKERMKSESAQKRRQNISTSEPVTEKASNKTTGESFQVPLFSTVESFCAAYEKLLIREIAFLRENGGKRVKLFDGKRVETKNGRHIYSFESDSELNLPDNTPITLWIDKQEHGTPADMIACEEFTVIIAVAVDLRDSISMIEFSAEPWRLLQSLIDRLNELSKDQPSIAKAIICDGKKAENTEITLFTGQSTACRMSLQQPITFIWGPPGTGKTETLATIALSHMQKGYRVLMLSYSNVSVDGAALRVFRKDKEQKPGKIVRYGYPRDKELLQHEYLSSYQLTLRNHPTLLKERASLAEEQKKLSRAHPRYVEIERRISQIKSQLRAEEKIAVLQAPFVATTVSKAVVDKILYEGSFDTVIFDEASMAYIPQVVFSAGLARKHFICIGDFSQLPPIVQSDKNSGLNADIFQYCGIVDAVEMGCGHKWLCLLDAQYRMHPEIAEFSSQSMYHGLLKSAAGMDKKRRSITSEIPFANEALYLVDLSGALSVCTQTAERSRINVLSAMLTMGLATNAAKKNEVGIITPYNAQSRLMHALSKDVEERFPELNKITCATVHQFQGAEKDVILYDAVDCYRMQYPGTLLASLQNNYANRLYNVAVTRAKGKMISVANMDYMRSKHLSQRLIFRTLMDRLSSMNKVASGEEIESEINRSVFQTYDSEERSSEAETVFLSQLDQAKNEIIIDVPTGMNGREPFILQFSKCLSKAKARGVRVFLRADNRAGIPSTLLPFAVVNRFVSNPVTVIDKMSVWYGMPYSKAEFQSEGENIPIRWRPIIHFSGKRFARALYGFLEMNRTLDASKQEDLVRKDGIYSNFASYVAGEVKCPLCSGAMQLKKSKAGKFFIACSNYPGCHHTQFVEMDMVNRYFKISGGKLGKRCPQDNTSLFAKIGKYGLYICCGALKKHTYKLDEI